LNNRIIISPKPEKNHRRMSFRVSQIASNFEVIWRQAESFLDSARIPFTRQ
jgi:hypothetical protein